MAWHYGRYARLRPVDGYQAVLRENVARREERFLELVKGSVFENSRTPYHDLMRLAGCTFEDLREMVGREGLEGALEQLRLAGVYMTHAEAKGAAVVRGGREIANDRAATRNPSSQGGMETISSGSRSAGMATLTSNAFRRYRSQYERLFYDEFGLEGAALATLQWTLPAPAGLLYGAFWASTGKRVERWFTAGGSWRSGAHYRLATAALVWEGRLLGRWMPLPEYLPQNDYSPVAVWIAETKKGGRRAYLRSNASACTRVCAAARDLGLDIAGTLFMISGEAVTEGKRALMESVGVRAYPRYVVSEVGTIGAGCAHLEGNSVHVYTDSVAVISYRRPAPFTDSTVNSLLLTSVNPLASRVYLNVEMDDCGDIGIADCGCLHSRLGYRTVIRDLYSFGKLSGHSTTLAGSDIVRILEERLPARFGGAPGDYQMVEEQGETQVEIKLRVSPGVKGADPKVVESYFLDCIRGVYGGTASRRVWEHSGSISAIIAEPHRTSTGKVLPLHLAGLGRKK